MTLYIGVPFPSPAHLWRVLTLQDPAFSQGQVCIACCSFCATRPRKIRMFFKILRTRRSPKSVTRQSVNDTPPPPASSSNSQCTSAANEPGSTTKAKKPDEVAHDYDLFLERARSEEENRAKARLQEIKEAQKRRAELSMDPWTRRM